MDNSFDSLLNVSAVPQDDKVQAFIAESKNNRNRCYELSEQVTAQVATDGQMFQKYLDVQSTFDRYTANNALLILAQRPDAQRLGDYGYWRDHGTYVKRMERQNPILIMEPGKTYEREDGSIGTYYNAKKLYDISQTTMTDKTAKENQYDERSLIRALVSNPPANIVAAEPDQMPDEKGAYFEPEEKCIYVRKGMGAQEIFRALCRNWYLQDMQKAIRTMTGVKMRSTHIVRPICCLKSMEWISASLILPMHRSFLKIWNRRR